MFKLRDQAAIDNILLHNGSIVLEDRLYQNYDSDITALVEESELSTIDTTLKTIGYEGDNFFYTKKKCSNITLYPGIKMPDSEHLYPDPLEYSSVARWKADTLALDYRGWYSFRPEVEPLVILGELKKKELSPLEEYRGVITREDLPEGYRAIGVDFAEPCFVQFSGRIFTYRRPEEGISTQLSLPDGSFLTIRIENENDLEILERSISRWNRGSRLIRFRD